MHHHNSPLLSLPEEILEHILALAISSPRRLWHPFSSPAWRARALLLVSRKINRIATPLAYGHLTIHTREQAHLLSRTLHARPDIASCVRWVVAHGCWNEVGRVLHFLAGSESAARLEVLDLTLDVDASSQVPIVLTSALQALVSLRHLILRKEDFAYLSHIKVKSVICALAEAIQGWSRLVLFFPSFTVKSCNSLVRILQETANIAFRLSDDQPAAVPPAANPTEPSSPSMHPSNKPTPVRALAHSLAHAPSLHTILTRLPSIWNPLLSFVSANPRLERIVLDPVELAVAARAKSSSSSSSSLVCYSPPRDPTVDPDASWAGWTTSEGITALGLFMAEARKFDRLSELIRAGTSVLLCRFLFIFLTPVSQHRPTIRTRARTIGTISPPPPGTTGNINILNFAPRDAPVVAAASSSSSASAFAAFPQT